MPAETAEAQTRAVTARAALLTEADSAETAEAQTRAVTARAVLLTEADSAETAEAVIRAVLPDAVQDRARVCTQAPSPEHGRAQDPERAARTADPVSLTDAADRQAEPAKRRLSTEITISAEMIISGR